MRIIINRFEIIRNINIIDMLYVYLSYMCFHSWFMCIDVAYFHVVCYNTYSSCYVCLNMFVLLCFYCNFILVV